jgi:two-component system, chemotaxis family, CheB/CheR fusion protein
VVDLRLIAGEAADAVRPQMADHGVEFAVELDSEPLWVFGDPVRLQQVHINLLSNAVKYTQRGGFVSLRVGREDSGVIIRVSDSGAGIAPQMIDSVFDLFVQGKQTLDRAVGGLGVGLTLVRALVEMHGGAVSARSDGEGAGSEFTVRLPLTALSAPASIQEATPLPGLTPGTTVVVVEDYADSRDVLCAMLRDAGLVCHGAADGRAALQLVDEISPDIVLLDVGLPEMDGLEVARRIRTNPKHRRIRLIALTGYGQSSDRDATARAGFDHHLVKPVQPAELLQVLSQPRTPHGSRTSDPASRVDSGGTRAAAP